MPATEYQGSSSGSSSPFASIGRSILSIRREQGHAAAAAAASGSEQGPGHDLEGFQRRVTERFQELSSAGDDVLLSLPWIRRLLTAFLSCQSELAALLAAHRHLLSRHPLDRLLADSLDRGLKALDLCNAVRDGVEQLSQWRRHLDIVLSSLTPATGSRRELGEGQVRRARKALADLAICMMEERDNTTVPHHHNRSFGRRGERGENHLHNHPRPERGENHVHNHPRPFRSHSWSISRSWSAARQLQAMANNLTPPRANDIAATTGLAVPIYTMNSVLLFAMWALVAAIPCQDRGIQTHFSAPRTFTWASPMLSLHARILEESKKRDHRNSCGLLKEIHQIEKCTRQLMEFTNAQAFPLGDELLLEIRPVVQELGDVCDVLKEGTDHLERQVREVFHGIMRSRTEGLDYLSHNPE